MNQTNVLSLTVPKLLNISLLYVEKVCNIISPVTMCLYVTQPITEGMTN